MKTIEKTVINPNGRIIVIGDLHGCVQEANELLEKCNYTSKDKVVFLGDLVDRGPDNAGCVDLAMKHECILGNHEERHIAYEDELKKRGTTNVRSPNHVATRMQLKPIHYDYFRSLPLYIRLPEHNAVCVHAGVFPNRKIEEQDPYHLLHIQSIKPYVTDDRGTRRANTKSMWPSKVPQHEEGWKFWTNFYEGTERIIFGHSVLDKPLITPNAIGLDGGCCFGLSLWALILPTMQIIEVKSHDPATKRNEKMKFVVNHDVMTFS